MEHHEKMRKMADLEELSKNNFDLSKEINYNKYPSIGWVQQQLYDCDIDEFQTMIENAIQIRKNFQEMMKIQSELSQL